ncbi:RelA/SpoT domain-containing protein [Sphingobacterium mizutaii]|uniref:RelA/SpoT domain-containing protein n=1 Tax=Sphingobacterium mizutaii TaxID=1010 RepID=UPI00162A2266|nr:RelA/SpoT domain-containing protein [Sphingobacterium mizutaii]
MSKTSLDYLAKKVSDRVELEVLKLGIQYRIFHRSKDLNSIKEKIERKEIEGSPYSVEGKKIRDIIGIRIVTYFQDDIPLVISVVNKTIEKLEQEIDPTELTVFRPKRTNITYSLNREETNLLSEAISINLDQVYKLADNTFELQLRTVLSEGWYEIDHNLRYKCQSDWDPYNEQQRMLNGIYASLETNDIAMKNLFNELAYQHFKAKNWEGLMRTKFRIRFKLSSLNDQITSILDNNIRLGKLIIKLDRQEMLLELAKFNNNIPLTLSNFFYLINYCFLKEPEIKEITPTELIDLFDKFYEK